MEERQNVAQLTRMIADFTGLIGKRLPDDVTMALKRLSDEETVPMAKMIYEAMEKNQIEAEALNRPSCQDTGVITIFAKVGSKFP